MWTLVTPSGVGGFEAGRTRGWKILGAMGAWGGVSGKVGVGV